MQIIHRGTQELIAESKRGQAIMPFEGNYYISKVLVGKIGSLIRYYRSSGFVLLFLNNIQTCW